MKERCCHYCGHPPPETRLGVRLTPLKARIYDIVQRAGIDGISAQDLWDIVSDPVGPGEKVAQRETLKSHIWQINDLIRDEGYEIRGSDGFYRLANTAQPTKENV